MDSKPSFCGSTFAACAAKSSRIPRTRATSSRPPASAISLPKRLSPLTNIASKRIPKDLKKMKYQDFPDCHSQTPFAIVSTGMRYAILYRHICRRTSAANSTEIAQCASTGRGESADHIAAIKQRNDIVMKKLALLVLPLLLLGAVAASGCGKTPGG